MDQRFDRIKNINIDYITVTCRDKHRQRRLQAHAELWLSDEVKQGNECREWAGHGYEGLAAGCVQLGHRKEDMLIRISGVEAHHKAPFLVDTATNCSRLDLASTVLVKQTQTHFAEACERAARRYKSAHGLKHQVELRRNTKTGNTLYLNRRVSDRFIRIYDKGRESKLPEMKNCWRAECQFNNGLAWSMVQRLALSGFDLLWINAVVCEELSKKGVPWLELPELPSIPPQVLLPSKSPAQASRRLAWLRSQVAPTIRKLQTQVSLEEIREALGL